MQSRWPLASQVANNVHSERGLCHPTLSSQIPQTLSSCRPPASDNLHGLRSFQVPRHAGREGTTGRNCLSGLGFPTVEEREGEVIFVL